MNRFHRKTFPGKRRVRFQNNTKKQIGKVKMPIHKFLPKSSESASMPPH